MVCTSPPYFGLRAYETEPQVWGAWRGELGSEPTIALYIEHLVEIFREVRRVLRPDGTLWLNIADAHAGSGKGPTGHNGIGNHERRQGFTGGSDPHGLRTSRAKIVGGGTLKAKDLCLIPERLAIALQDDGWWARSRIAWCKTAPMPESVQDRPTSAWEYIWLLTPRHRYFYDGDAVRQAYAPNSHARYQSKMMGTAPQARQPGKEASLERREKGRRLRDPNLAGTNLRDFWEIEAPPEMVWKLGPEPFREAHFAVFPSAIPRRAILAGTSAYGACAECGGPWRRQAGWEPGCKCDCPDVVPCTVLDPFVGSGTTLLVAKELGRNAIGIELSADYCAIAERRIARVNPALPGLVV